jgi:hypothetical protein
MNKNNGLPVRCFGAHRYGAVAFGADRSLLSQATIADGRRRAVIEEALSETEVMVIPF